MAMITAPNKAPTKQILPYGIIPKKLKGRNANMRNIIKNASAPLINLKYPRINNPIHIHTVMSMRIDKNPSFIPQNNIPNTDGINPAIHHLWGII